MTRSRRLRARPGKNAIRGLLLLLPPPRDKATKNLVATTGKARSLGERSLGHPDPGAITISLILKAMNEFVAKA